MAAASSDWKHPSDHPPPDNSWVLIRHINGYVGTGKYVRGTWRMTGKTGAVSPRSITHWAEIYKPPKDNQNTDNTTKQATT